MASKSAMVSSRGAAMSTVVEMIVREPLRSTSRLLVTILLGGNVVNVLGTSVASVVAVSQPDGMAEHG